jgi:hypothetical protein
MLKKKGIEEAEGSRVEINDIQPEVLRGLVEFAYKGKVCAWYNVQKMRENV